MRGESLANPGTLIPGSGQPSDHPGSWPQFRGAARENIAATSRGIARSWPPDGPPVLWRVRVGEGHAGAAIRKGRVYLIDYDREKEEDAVRCLSLDTGEEIWRYTYSVSVKRNHGMSRTVPAVNDRVGGADGVGGADEFVVTIGPKCHVHCLDAVSGELVWRKDLVAEHGTKAPLWYAGQCPLIEGDRVILAPGAKPLMMAVDLASGKTLWVTPPQYDDYGMTHSSITPMDSGGRRQYIYCAEKGAVGVAADDGRVLWELPEWRIKIANIPSPVVVGEDRVFLTGGYDAGCMMIRLKAEGDAIKVEQVFRLASAVFGSDQQTPVLYKGHLFAVEPKPNAEMVCLTLEGRRLWSSGGRSRFGLGPYLIVDDLMLALDDQEGTLHLAETDPSGYRELAKAKLLSGRDAWGPMAAAEGRLILRDLTEMICVDLSVE